MTQRKSDHLKLLTNTYRADRAAKIPPAPVDLGPMVAPDWLNERARQIFDQIVGILKKRNTASALYTTALSLLADRLAEVERLTAHLAEHGATYQTTTREGSIMHRSRPEIRMRADAIRHSQSLLAEFGLSPASLGKVTFLPVPEKKNEFDDI